ncbi:OLC1v1037563C1 [Oldenlandia corymbosa var. corymbosa]|uniref:OLC1v1037563C1 n=1 Tax=Oldenlandia corymbosa var. corymbosa TaxID=529605 RepID=A0AAV1D0T7_OLDCO|nr:OLC1v1037563C1 [Oldenlandia corymbosa var. corymbosa]
MMPPDELMLEILTRLPGKQLGKCKCVCKSWQSLIGGPVFMDIYRNRQRRLILYSALRPRESLYSRLSCFSSTLGRLKESTEEFSCLSELQIKPFYCTQAVNGLMCIIENDCRISVYNICTGQLMSVPEPNDCGSDTRSTFHFGYDPVSKVYKLIRLMCSGNSRLTQVEVINLRPSNSSATWRKLDNDACDLSDFRYLVSQFLFTDDGFLWFLSGLDSLFSFDLNKEKFKRIKLPEGIRDETQTFNLIQSMGRPAMWVLPKAAKSSCFILFVLENYEGDMWNKYCVQFPEELGGFHNFTIDMGNLPTGEILLTNVMVRSQDHYMSVYAFDHHTSKFDHFLIREFPKRPHAYVRGSQNHGHECAKISCLHDNNCLYLSLNDILSSGGV